MAEIYLYDEIGPSWLGLIDDKTVAAELAAIGPDEPVTVRINSPGGDAFAGISIYNALRRHQGFVTVAIDALAASAASVIAMAGDEIEIADNAHMMIHSAWTVTYGNATELEKTVEMLRNIDGSIASTYAKRTDNEESNIRSWMEEETWFTASEAVANGFANSVVGTHGEIAAAWTEGIAKRPPQEVLTRNRTALPKPRRNPTKEQLAERKSFINRMIADSQVKRRKLGA